MTTYSTIGHRYKFVLKYITKQKYLVLVIAEMHRIFDTLSRTQAYVRYLHLGVRGGIASGSKKVNIQRCFDFLFN